MGVNVIFCGSAPLPEVLTIDGPCVVRTDGEMGDLVGDGDTSGRYIKAWEALPLDDLLTEVYTNGGNNATSVAGAETLADGASTTFASFQEALIACTVDECNVYFNIHTKYSFDLSAGAYGLARAQLTPITCEKDKLKEGYKMETAKCFLAMATSNNTNLVTGIPNQLAPDAGATPGHDGEGLLVVYQGGTGPASEDSAAAGPGPGPAAAPPPSTTGRGVDAPLPDPLSMGNGMSMDSSETQDQVQEQGGASLSSSSSSSPGCPRSQPPSTG